MSVWVRRALWVLAIVGTMAIGGVLKGYVVDPIINDYRDFQTMRRYIAQSQEFRRWAAGPPRAPQPQVPVQPPAAPPKTGN